jgi:hypothetical protein
VGLLIFLSLLLPMILATVIHDGPYAASPSLPFLFAAGMLNYHDIDEYILGTIRYTSSVADWQERMRIQTTWSVTIGSIVYVCLAPILLILAWLRLDRVLDRPRRGILAEPVPTLTKPKVRIRLEKDDLPATPVG